MLRKVPVYPFLFAGFSVLALMANNIHEISIQDMWSSLLYAVLLSAATYGFVRLLIRDRQRSALISLGMLFFFFTYGHVYNSLNDVTLRGVDIFRHRNLLFLYGLPLLFFVYWVLRRAKDPERFTHPLNLLSIFLLVYPTFSISSNVLRQSMAYRSAINTVAVQSPAADSEKPDIYYIILDAYGREDILKKYLGFDNSAFVTALRERGFYVADCSQSNYGYTEYSVTSSLNYDYLDALNVSNDIERVAALKQNAVRSFLREQGYRIVSAPTGWDMTEWRDADLYLEDPSYSSTPEFEKLVMDTSLLRIATDSNLFNVNRITRQGHRSRVLYLLEQLKQLPKEDGNLFVFAHMVIPHPPYRFGPNGEWLDEDPEDDSSAYVDQAIFINREILQVIDEILASSEIPPVIIIQGDHGPPPELSASAVQKMPILNAYYLPGIQADHFLYPSISPVNSFRVVLDAYFGQNLPLLDDVSYYAPNSNHSALELVPNTCQGQP